MVSARPLIYNSSNPLCKPLETVPNATITIGITLILMFYSFFFNSQARFKYMFSLVVFLIFFLCLPGTQGPLTSKFTLFFFLLIIIWSGVLGDPFVSESSRQFCKFHSPGQMVWFEHTPFCCVVNHFLHPVMPSLVLPLC